MVNYVLIFFLIAHFLGDYYLQCEKMAIAKYNSIGKLFLQNRLLELI
ncbi:MAG TPA: DUF3307 domain-containing protein [Gallicola sp.]|jgi:hypothetical protein|nr:DUF3307 domain-containing protein [Gallicola sp.]